MAYTFSELPVMEPFRHLLSTKTPFAWSSELEAAFKASKEAIIKACVDGVRTFDPNLPTCLATDWSRMGIGYWLCQKHCQCAGETPRCCRDGWQTVYMGSRFCTNAETRYAPIEGEALAAAWGTAKCKHYLLGMPHWTLAVDHKPLVPILSTKDLDAIPNPRILNQRVKLLPYNFTPKYIPGKENVTPDTLSRGHVTAPVVVQPQLSLQDVTNVETEYADTFGPPGWVARPVRGVTEYIDAAEAEDDSVEGIVKSSIAEIAEAEILVIMTHLGRTSGVRAITWRLLQEETAGSHICRQLLQLIGSGLPDRKEDWPGELSEYHQYRNQLLEVDGVVVYGERPLIPASLRSQVLDILHAGHAGASTMRNRSTQSVFWPGMTREIEEKRATCRACILRAPSQAAQPPQPPVVPEYPFAYICCDFFQVNGVSYLATVDRFSNWLSVSHFKKDDSKAVISFLRSYFTRYGIAKEITTDGQKTLCSAEVEDFLARWGVKHRVSSAYHPMANKRAEVAVKQAKRLIEGNLGAKGELETERFSRALIEHRNSPDPLTGLSPAMVVFGRKLRGFLPDDCQKRQCDEWRIDMETREKAFAKRHSTMAERLESSTRKLKPLPYGTEVVVQDPSLGGKAGRWTKSGTIIECLPNESYLVRVHGSRALTKRNRIHIRKILPMVPDPYIIPADHPAAAEAPEVTKTEVTDRYVEVQPPRQWTRLSPDRHRQTPAACPGGDVVRTLREEERRAQTGAQTGAEPESEITPMDAWADVREWRRKFWSGLRSSQEGRD